MPSSSGPFYIPSNLERSLPCGPSSHTDKWRQTLFYPTVSVGHLYLTLMSLASGSFPDLQLLGPECCGCFYLEFTVVAGLNVWLYDDSFLNSFFFDTVAWFNNVTLGSCSWTTWIRGSAMQCWQVANGHSLDSIGTECQLLPSASA